MVASSGATAAAAAASGGGGRKRVRGGDRRARKVAGAMTIGQSSGKCFAACACARATGRMLVLLDGWCDGRRLRRPR